MTVSVLFLQMWSIEFVQVLDEAKQREKDEQKDDAVAAESPSSVSAPKPIPVLNRASSSVVDPSPTEETLAADRLQGFKDPGTHLATKEAELGSSAESEGGGGGAVESLKQHLDRVSQLQHQPLDGASLDSSDDLLELSREVQADVDSALDVAATLDNNSSHNTPPSEAKEQMSPTSDFVFVTENEVKDAVKSANDSAQKFSPRKIRGLREGTLDANLLKLMPGAVTQLKLDRQNNKSKFGR